MATSYTPQTIGNELTASVKTIVLFVMSVVVVPRMYVTMARLAVVCSSILQAAPHTAPLTFLTASS